MDLSKKILFVCFANAGRSQLAEAITKNMKPYFKSLEIDSIEFFSGGVHPVGYIVDEVYEIAEERYFDIDDQYSKSFLDAPIEEIDFVINMSRCDISRLLKQRSFKGELIEWDVPDPIGTGIEEYRKTADLIESLLVNFIKEKL
jgi:protein-tyrosine-phosphatase